MVSESNLAARGELLKTWFNDSIGSYWEIDLTAVYDNATEVKRTVAHLFPGIVLVHDRVELPKEDSIALRWHTATVPYLSKAGDFSVKNNNAFAQVKVVSLDNKTLSFRKGNHEFKAPYNLTRQGDPLIQNYESFVEVSTYGKSSSILTLFAVSELAVDQPKWQKNGEDWRITIGEEEYVINATDTSFELNSTNSSRQIVVN